MSITSQSNRSFVEAEQYSDFILTTLHDGLLPTSFYRNVSDFGAGEVLNIKTIGEAQIQEVEEDAPIKYSPIESGEVELRITEYVGDGWYVTDKMRQDGAQIEQLQAARSSEATRAIQEYFETQSMATLNAAQTNSDPNTINGFAHRIVSAETNGIFAFDHLIALRLAFNKAEVPMGGRIGIVDPIVEATLNTKYQVVTGNLNANPTVQGIFQDGWAREHSFVTSIFGWDILTSNRLPKLSVGDGTTTIADGVANLFMCVLDDNCKPLMAAWRQMPKVEGDRNKDLQRDEFVQTARFGFGAQRVDTLGVVGTSASLYA
jgi:hypothetical protein